MPWLPVTGNAISRQWMYTELRKTETLSLSRKVILIHFDLKSHITGTITNKVNCSNARYCIICDMDYLCLVEKYSSYFSVSVLSAMWLSWLQRIELSPSIFCHIHLSFLHPFWISYHVIYCLVLIVLRRTVVDCRHGGCLGFNRRLM